MKLIEQFKMLSGMSGTRRYSQTTLIKEENILEHTAFVALVANHLALEVNRLENSPNIVDGVRIDMGTLLQKALHHDIEEFLTGDVPRPTKYFSEESKAAFDAIAREGMKKVLARIEFSHEAADAIWNSWEYAKDGPEGVLIAIADLTAVVYKLWDEVTLMGNRKLLLVCNKIQEYITSGREKVAREFDPSNPAYWFLCTYLDELKIIAAQAGVNE